jgi:hypothetical protein
MQRSNTSSELIASLTPNGRDENKCPYSCSRGSYNARAAFKVEDDVVVSQLYPDCRSCSAPDPTTGNSCTVRGLCGLGSFLGEELVEFCGHENVAALAQEEGAVAE